VQCVDLHIVVIITRMTLSRAHTSDKAGKQSEDITSLAEIIIDESMRNAFREVNATLSGFRFSMPVI